MKSLQNKINNASRVVTENLFPVIVILSIPVGIIHSLNLYIPMVK